MTKRIVIHFEDEAGVVQASQFRKQSVRAGDVVLMSGRPYVVTWRRESSTSIDFGARPERSEAQELSAEEMR